MHLEHSGHRKLVKWIDMKKNWFYGLLELFKQILFYIIVIKIQPKLAENESGEKTCSDFYLLYLLIQNKPLYDLIL